MPSETKVTPLIVCFFHVQSDIVLSLSIVIFQMYEMYNYVLCEVDGQIKRIKVLIALKYLHRTSAYQ